MAQDIPVKEVIQKPVARVVVEFTDGTCLDISQGNVVHVGGEALHSNFGYLVIKLQVITIAYEPKLAANVLINPTPVPEGRRDERKNPIT